MSRHNKRGLRVAHCELVVRSKFGSNQCISVADAATPAGWYIQVWRVGRWYSLMDLRFKREKDALRGAQALTAAGLDSHHALSKADPLTVKQIATECLQW